MARPLSATSIRRQAVQALRDAITAAQSKGDYQAAGAFAIRLEQMANRLERRSDGMALSLTRNTPAGEQRANVRVHE
jgi:hypothetical protein